MKKTWEFKTSILLFSFFDWTPNLRNKNQTENKLVMRPWQLGNLDVFLLLDTAYRRVLCLLLCSYVVGFIQGEE